jgi:4-amino-4-deoxy-L-arabinose transferase-like glycosyltransferase
MRRNPIIIATIFFFCLLAAFFIFHRFENSFYGLNYKIVGQNRSQVESSSRIISLEVLRNNPNLSTNFEIHWSGYFYAPTTRLYPVLTAADDRLQLKIDGNLVTTRDASKGHQTALMIVPFRKGFHRIEADYQQFTGERSLLLRLNHSNPILERLDPPAYFREIPSGTKLMAARVVTFAHRALLVWIAIILFFAIIASASYSLRSISPSSAEQKMLRLAKIAIPALIILYAALLRFEALTIKHGIVESPVLIRTLQQHSAPLKYLHPDTLQWKPGSNPYEKGDPINYLRMARAMKGFYAAQFREPFYVWIVKQFLEIFDQKDIAVSFASAFFSVMAVLATFIVAQYAFSFWVGVIAALTMTIDQELISIGVDGWRDDTFMFLVLMFCYAMLRLFRKASFGNALFAAIVGGLVCLTRMTSFSFIVPGYLYVLLAGKETSIKTRFKFVALSAVMFVIVIAPFLINCAIVYGDPLFSVNDNTKFYRSRENIPEAEKPMSVVSYLTGRLFQRPFKFIDTGFEGLTRYPFLNKWKGFAYISPLLSKFLASCAVIGTILLLFSSRGRLMLLLLLSSLIPYAFTYEIAGGNEWRFTMHAYPFYLIAGALFFTAVIGALLAANTWPLFSDQPFSKRTVLTTSFILLFVLAGGWFLLNQSNFLRKEEATKADEAILVQSGNRDSRFFTSGWYEPVQVGGEEFRITKGTEAVLSAPLKRNKEYNLILRANPVFEKPLKASIISVNINSQPVGKFELKEPAKTAYVFRLPPNFVKDGINEIELNRLDPESSDIAIQYYKLQTIEAFQYAMEKYENNELDEAIHFFELALTQRIKRQALPLYYLGMCYLKKNQPEKAIQMFNEAISQSRGNIQILEARAEAYLQTKQYDAAIKDLTKVLNKEPKNENAQRLLLLAQQSQK